jgi:hypothetical protein
MNTRAQGLLAAVEDQKKLLEEKNAIYKKLECTFSEKKKYVYYLNSQKRK